MSKTFERWSMTEMMMHAARGARKVDLWGERGVTLVSHIEIDAMACALVAFGLNLNPGATPAPDGHQGEQQ